MKIVIVGAHGQLGSAVVRELRGDGLEVTALARRVLDVTSRRAVDGLMAFAPDVIINCTAWNDVDGAETQAAAAFAVNHTAVSHLAGVARRAGATLVHYSSDFVFDGRGHEPYVEDAIPSPLNVYGRSKLAGEEEARQVSSHYIVRLSSVFGGRKGEGRGGRGTIDRMLDALLTDKAVGAFTDRTVTPSYTVDVARATHALLMRGAPYGVYHCVSSQSTTWYRLAEEAARIVESRSRVVPVLSEDVATIAVRPRYCALANEKLALAGYRMAAWPDALRRHLADRLFRQARPDLSHALTLQR